MIFCEKWQVYLFDIIKLLFERKRFSLICSDFIKNIFWLTRVIFYLYIW